MALNNNHNRAGIIQTVQTPLGFFALVVLVVEIILGITANFSEGEDRTFLLRGMLFLIFFLVAIVASFAFFRPEALSGSRPYPTIQPFIIHSATYGKGTNVFNVADIVREKILFPTYLNFQINNENLGGDPLEGVVKELYIDYSYAGQRKSRKIPENENLYLP